MPLFRTIRLLLIASVLLACQAHPAWALDPNRGVDEYTVTSWSMEDGLPHNLVHDIVQDRDGYLWVGSWEGAARFNGRQFRRFDDHQLHERSTVGVRSIVVDTDGSLLMGTAQFGVMRLANGVWSALEATVAQRLRALTLARVGDGALWIGTEDSAWRLAADGDLVDAATLGLPQGAIYALLDLGTEGVLVGGDAGPFLWRDGKIDRFGGQLGIADMHVRALLLRRDGSLVLGGDHGAVEVDAARSTVRKILDARVESLLEDRDGMLWLGTSADGLFRHHQGRTDVIDQRLGLYGRGSPALMEDREGLIWMGTTNGLFRIADGPVFGLDVERGLSDNYPRVILPREDGGVYIGHAGGLDHWHQGRTRVVSIGRPSSSVLALADARDGGLWVGTYDQGVVYLPPDHDVARIRIIDSDDGLPSHHIRGLWEEADGRLWVGTTNGLLRLDPDGGRELIDSDDGLPGNFIRGLVPARGGGLWIATTSGMARLHADGQVQAWNVDSGFPGIGSFDFLEEQDGDLWIGTDAGLLRLRDGAFTIYDRAAGLPNESIFRVLKDAQGAFWLCSNQGVFRIESEQFTQYDQGRLERLRVDVLQHADGMPSSQCNGGSSPAGNRDAEGRLWMPTAQGVAVIDPELTVSQALVKVPVRIEGVQLDARALPPQPQLTLDAGVRRVVIHYAGLHFRAPLRVRYRYRMLGFDHDWVEAGDALEAVYTNLPSGRLHFQVQAAMSPADWSQVTEVASIELKVVPPFWQRPWFAVLAGLAALGVMLGVSAWRSARYQRRQLALTRTIEERTRELSDKNRALERADRERESLLEQLAYQASHDALTGLPNRRAGEARLVDAVQHAASGHAGPLCVALLDLDRFKQINDEHGHEAGDGILRKVAGHFARFSLLGSAHTSRYGGEEFLLLLPDTPLPLAVERLEALAAAIAGQVMLREAGLELGCTVSIGIAQWQPGMSPSQLVALADRRLYLAKQTGRNKVVWEGEGPD